MDVIAFDIETCPLPTEGFTDRQRRRFDKERKRLLEKGGLGKSNDEISAMARGMHPWLGWVCCIGVAWRTAGRVETHVPYTGFDAYQSHSWTADGPDVEEDMLLAFWQDMDARFQPQTVVSFNGKRFDSPFLKTRSLVHAVQFPPVAGAVLNTHRWQDRPHCDLMHQFDHACGLADVCELLGVESPKAGIDGSGVAAAVEAGRIDDVAAYCERDVRATLECYDVLQHLRGLR